MEAKGDSSWTHADVVRSLEAQATTEKQSAIKQGVENVVSKIKTLEDVANYVPVGIIGSTSFYDRTGRSERICQAIGQKLAQRRTLLLTGGMTGIAESMGRGFWAEAQKNDSSVGLGRVFHLLPAIGFEKWEYGTTISAGQYMEDRRIILAKCAKVFYHDLAHSLN